MKRQPKGYTNLINVFVSAMSLAIIFSSCKKNDDTPPPPAKEITLTTSATLGSILTDKTGRTLYVFANDAAGANTCTGGCEAVWPVFNVDNLTAGPCIITPPLLVVLTHLKQPDKPPVKA
jgi:predicted lipoprotein with Yx(FWY)xxD motif